MITRKPILGDVAHGYNNNDCFADAGIPYYQDNGDVNHCDKFVNDACFNYDDTTQTMNVTNACVHCDLTVDNNALICNDAEICGNACVDSNLTVTCAICGCSTLEVDDNATFHCNATVDENLTVCCDAEVCNDMTVDCNTCLKGTLDVDGVSNFNCTVYVNGDLHVKGTSYDEHTVDLLVGADHITLRECATQGLGSQERAGIIIDHYDATGNKSLGIVGDYTGTARVGEIEIVHVWTTDDTVFYSDREMTVPVTIPTGKQLFQIGDTDPTTGEKEYYYVANDDTEPVATRSENMCDHQLTCWNATNCDIETIGSLPSNNGAILQYDLTNCCYCHLENPGADGRLLTYDCTGDKLKWNENGPTGNEQILKWNACTKAFEYLPIGNDGEVLSTCVKCDYDYGLKPISDDQWYSLDMSTRAPVPTPRKSVCFYGGGNRAMLCCTPGSTTTPYYYYTFNSSFSPYWAGGCLPFVYNPTDGLMHLTNEVCISGQDWHYDPFPYNCTCLGEFCGYRTCGEVLMESLTWKCGPSSYVFNTMADYTAVAATIPANSQVTILCENNYTTSEQV